MQYGLEEMRRINGNTSNDHEIASVFCKEAHAQAQKCLNVLSQIKNLKVCLDTSSLQASKDAIATLRQFDVAVREIAQFHQQGDLGRALRNLKTDIEKMFEEAAEYYKAFSSLFPT